MMVFGDEERYRLPERFGRCIAKRRLRAFAEKPDPVCFVHRDNGVRSRIHNRLEALPVLAQRLVLLPTPGPLARLRQFARHRRGEAMELVFHQVVVRAGTHQLDGDLFAHRARDHDERDVETGFPQQGERLRRAEGRHFEIRQHDIPCLLRQRGAHLRGAFHPLVPDFESGLLQLAQHQPRVAGGVFDDQDAKRRGGRVLGGVHGGLRP